MKLRPMFMLSPRHCKASPGTAPRWVHRSAGSQPVAERPRGSAPRLSLLHAGRHFEWQTTCSAAGLRRGYRSPSVRLPAGPPAHRSEPRIRIGYGNSLSSGNPQRPEDLIQLGGGVRNFHVGHSLHILSIQL